MTHFRIYILFLFFSCSVFAQEEASSLELRTAESQLKLLFDHLYEGKNPNADSCLLLAREKMVEVLALPGAMDYPWSRLNRIGVVDSEDGKLRVFSWHHEENQESFRYYAFLQLFLSNNPNNWPGFKSERYDELLKASSSIEDRTERMQTLADAELEMMSAYPLLPISYYVGRRLVSPRVKGWVDTANGPTPSRYLSVER